MKKCLGTKVSVELCHVPGWEYSVGNAPISPTIPFVELRHNAIYGNLFETSDIIIRMIGCLAMMKVKCKRQRLVNIFATSGSGVWVDELNICFVV